MMWTCGWTPKGGDSTAVVPYAASPIRRAGGLRFVSPPPSFRYRRVTILTRLFWTSIMLALLCVV
jgi:hypothetical protein